MSWTDLDVDDVAKLSYPQQRQGIALVREPGPAKIYVEAQAKDAREPLYLRVPQDFIDRLDRCLGTPKGRSAAVIAIMDEALDRLEAGDECWRVVAAASSSKPQ